MRIGIGIGMWVRHAAARGLAVAGWVLAVCALAVAGASAASAATWTPQTVPGPSGPPNAAMTGVSCASATFCMAVGSSDFGFDHTQTQLLAPIATFAARWDGSAWVSVPTPAAGASATLASLSCPSPTFCVAVGFTHSPGRQYVAGFVPDRNTRAVVEVWNGTRWAVQATPLASVRGSLLSGVSCVSSRYCLAVGSWGIEASFAIAWNGTRWRRLPLPAIRFNPSLAGVSCVAVNACTAVGSYDVKETGEALLHPLAARWLGRRWTVATPPAERDRFHGKPFLNYTWLTAVSCPSRTSCLATGLSMRTQNIYPQGGFADRWDGHRWTAATAGIARDSPLNGVSCVAPGDCYAAGQYDPRTIAKPSTQAPLLAHWASGRWTRESLPPVATLPNPVWVEDNNLDPNFFGISCVRQTGCTAVGAQPQGAHSAPLAMSDLAPPA
jgi:hypothetical protein